MSLLQNLTSSLLAFSKLLAAVAIPRRELRQVPKKTVISGAYVPALHHLLEKYRVPTRRGGVWKARCLEMCRGYVEAACLGFPDGFWWQFLVRISEMLGTEPSVDDPSVLFTDVIHDCKFVFPLRRGVYGVVVCDEVKGAAQWLDGATESVGKFSTSHGLLRAVLVGQSSNGKVPNYLPGGIVALVVDDDPYRAAERVVANF